MDEQIFDELEFSPLTSEMKILTKMSLFLIRLRLIMKMILILKLRLKIFPTLLKFSDLQVFQFN